MRSDPSTDAGRSAARQGRTVVARNRRRRLAGAAIAGVLVAVAVAVAGAGSIAAVVAGAVAVTVTRLAGASLDRRSDPQRWSRGAQGELATAALLGGLPARRWVVLHDRAVPRPHSRANMDHVVVGRTGVWVVDSKAFRGELRAGWRSVRAGEHRLDTAAVSFEAACLEEVLGVRVRPVVAVHGRGLRRRGARVDGVPVVPAASLLRLLSRRRHSARLGRRAVAELGRRCDVLLAPAAPGPRRAVAGRSR